MANEPGNNTRGTCVAMITGAAGVIGQAIARRFSTLGHHLVLSDRTVKASSDIDADWIIADVADPASVEALVKACVERHGRLDIAVTVAGVTSAGSFGSITPAEWDRVQGINLRGTFLVVQQALAVMKAQRYGRIVTIGSILAKNGGNPRPWLFPEEQNSAANAAYGAAKAGVHALTLYAAKEAAAFGITVNCVAPGPVASPMTTALPEALLRQIPIGRLGRAEEIAHAVAYLVAEEAAGVTGEIMDVNGGLWLD